MSSPVLSARLASFACVLLGISVAAYGCSAATPKASPITVVDQFILNQAQQEQFSGSVLVAQNGKILLDKGYGWADEQQQLANQHTTEFRIASLTKQFTAMGILLLQEQGKLRVQDHICLYIVGCPTTWKAITIHHLLTHTSGIPNYLNGVSQDKAISPGQLVAVLKDEPLGFVPGTEWSYSNAGYIVLGYIIERVSGISYAAFLQRAVWGALNLRNTGYDQNSPPLPEHATGYQSPWVRANFVDMSVPFAAGALYSTVDDLYHWDEALFNRTFASVASVTQMVAPQVSWCDPQGTICTGAECTAQGNNCSSYGYGLGLWQSVWQQHARVIGHDGMIDGFRSRNVYYPDQKLTFIVLSNIETFDPDLINTVVEASFLPH